jgi:hypothetical protein
MTVTWVLEQLKEKNTKKKKPTVVQALGYDLFANKQTVQEKDAFRYLVSEKRMRENERMRE